MKNMKISAKLLISFAFVVLLTVIVGCLGIYGMLQLNHADQLMYDSQVAPMPTIAKIIEYSQRMRVQMRNCIIYEGNAKELQAVETDVNDRIKQFEQYLLDYEPTIDDDEAAAAFDSAKGLYYNTYKPALLEILSGAQSGAEASALKDTMTRVTDANNKMVDDFNLCLDKQVEAAKRASDENAKLATELLVTIIIILTVSIVLAMILSVVVARIIASPIKFMETTLARIGTKGDLTFSDSDRRIADEYASHGDETGSSMKMLLVTIDRLNDVGGVLGQIAGGDLTHEIDLLSDNDSMGVSVHKMVEGLNEMFGEIHVSTAQVAEGSKQISDGSQVLAHGSSEQAAAVEQLSASISEISQKTKENAERADHAATLAETIKKNAEKGSRQMDQMMLAVREINQASQGINKVIKVIDDIAFQTNILALNAAVEAARAGQHGKGFAVVAEEVRNLAAKSAEAAKDTGGLIANSIEKAEFGARIADETAASLNDIVAGINESTLIVNEIAQSSESQTSGIMQINKGIDQVAHVIQQNSATSEESAAASEELSSQSHVLEDLISQFKLKNDYKPIPAKQKKHLTMPAPNTDHFGKY